MITLKKGRESLVSSKHHWIFSGAIENLDEIENGAVLPFFDSEGILLGHAYFNKNCSLCGRIVSFGNRPYQEAIEKSIERAFRQRELLQNSSAYRLIHAEADQLPGLIVDRYGDYLVMQIGTLGMEKLKPLIIAKLQKLFSVKGIYEKSTSASRKEEGLSPFEGTLFGEVPDQVLMEENNIKFLVPIKSGQKTGFFLDQREMRKLLGEMAHDKKILNAFSYTGGFTLHALRNNATLVHSLDTSNEAHELAKKNIALNNLPLERATFETQDVITHLRTQTTLDYDIVILDPPAFAKKKKDIDQALKAYKELNFQAISKMKPNSILFTFSCSYYIDEPLFRKMIFQAAKKAARNLKIISSHRQSFDHPTNIFHRETEYLKGFIMYLF